MSSADLSKLRKAAATASKRASSAEKPASSAPKRENASQKKVPEPPKAGAAKTELDRKIIDLVMEDQRLINYTQVAVVLMAVRKRKDEIEGKTKTVKDVIDEEIKKLVEKG